MKKLCFKIESIPTLSLICLVLFICWSNLIIDVTDASKYLLTNKSGCSVKDQRRVDRIASKFYSPGPNAPYFPTNYQELKPFCQEVKNVSKTIENFMFNCYSREVIQYAKIIFYSVNKYLRYYCSKRTKRLNQLLKLAPCINENLRTETVCLDIWLRDFAKLPDLENDKEKIIYGCCITASVFRCMDVLVDKYECTRQNKEEILDFMYHISGDYINTVCGEYNSDSDACDTMRPLKFAKTSNYSIVRRQQSLKFKTPMFILIDLLDSFVDPDSIPLTAG